MSNFEKLKVREVIVVEGRDDTNAVLRAIDGLTIETHGFGIKKETWDLLEKAYKEKGLIILTDPDYSGEEIRRKLTARFPESRQAFLTRSEAEKKGDIGIENAEPADIAEAIRKAHYTASAETAEFTEDD
ncbi:MAG: toprim domain-containing protein, partial [Firmicutes bacterium]|nr:toprim domain-containing protein [Bacillota bacterium]